jgi:tetratricopeptide (TPR) repeat protein
LLQHPHIVPIYNVGVERGIHYFAMQLIEGVSIDQWIFQRQESGASQVAHQWRKVVQWAIHAADSLQAAHETGVIHRDIKPSNLMLDANEKIWITDFGLARCQTDASLTQSGDLLGTLRYMSPEQACGESAMVDGRSDIYSLAATIFEMLALRPVHDGQDGPAVLRQIASEQLLNVRRCCPGIPRDLEVVLAKGLARNRDDRYQTARDFANDLQRVLSGQPTHARPQSYLDRCVNWASRHRRGVAISLLVGALGLVGLAISTALIAREKRISDANADRSERNEALARQAVDQLGTQIAELLIGIPDADPIRRRLLLETLAYYERFASTAHLDDELREDLAITHGKIGSIQAELGARDQALEAFDQSEQLYNKLANENPSDRRIVLAWSISLNNLAQSLQAVGRLQDAAATFAKSTSLKEQLIVEIQRSLDESLSASDLRELDQDFRNEVQLQLAATLSNLGLLLAEAGINDRAEASYTRAIRLLASTESSHQSERLLSSINANLSGLLTASDPKRAIVLARAALSSQSSSLESDPANPLMAMQIIVSLNALGRAQAANSQYEPAIASFRQAITIGEQLTDRWPQHPGCRRDLALSWNQLGLSQSRLNALDAARHAFEQAERNQNWLIDKFPDDAEAQSIYGGIVNNLGFLHQQLGDASRAIEFYHQAVKAQQQAVEMAPQVVRYREYLQKQLANLRSLEEA